jgi:hypothetical protein
VGQVPCPRSQTKGQSDRNKIIAKCRRIEQYYD